MANTDYKFKVRNRTGDGYVNILKEINIEVDDTANKFSGNRLDEVLNELFDASDVNTWDSYTDADNSTQLSVNSNSFVDTTNAPFVLVLPETPSSGDYVRIADMAGQLNVNNLIIERSTSNENIMGLAEDLILDVRHIGLTLTYSGISSSGWIITYKT